MQEETIRGGPDVTGQLVRHARELDEREDGDWAPTANTARLMRQLLQPRQGYRDKVAKEAYDRVFINTPEVGIFESDPAYPGMVQRACIPRRSAQSWWSFPSSVPNVYYQKADPFDRGPVVTPDFNKVAAMDAKRQKEAAQQTRQVMLRYNRMAVRHCIEELRKAEADLRELRQGLPELSPTGRHDPNPYDESSRAWYMLPRDNHIFVMAAKRVQTFTRRLHNYVVLMPVSELEDALAAVRAERGCPPHADNFDDWDQAMRSTDFVGWLMATDAKPKRDEQARLLNEEEVLYRRQMNWWYAEEAARYEAEEAHRAAEPVDEDDAHLLGFAGPERGRGRAYRHVRRDVFGDPIPQRPELRPPRHRIIRHTITVATKLIPWFAHKGTKAFLSRNHWFHTVDGLVLHMYQTNQIQEDSDEKYIREFLAEHLENCNIARRALLEALDSTQLDSALKNDYFDVLCDGGRLRYRIRLWAPHQNVFLLDGNRSPIVRLCGYLPDAHISSSHLMQKLTLDADYSTMHKRANETCLIKTVPVNEGFGIGPLGLPQIYTRGDEDWSLTMAAPRWGVAPRQLTDEEREELRIREQEEAAWAHDYIYEREGADIYA